MKITKYVAALLIGATAIAHAGTKINAPGDINNFNTAAIAATTGSYLPIHGTADNATKLITARTITDSGDVTGTGTFDGSGNLTRTITFATVGAGGTCGDSTHTSTITFNVKGLTIACTATAISGVPAATAVSLLTPRSIGALTGDVTSTGSNFDGTAPNTNSATLATSQSNTHTWVADQIFQGNVQYNPSGVSLGTSATIDAVRPISADGRGSTPAIMRSTSETGGAGFQAIRVSSDTTGPTSTLRKARGTVASLASVQNGDSLGMMIWSGYASTPSANSVSVARIDTIITEPTPTSSVMGGDMVISTIKIGTGTTVADLRISADTGITATGNVNVGALLSLHNYVVSGLPTCNGTTQGSLAYVTDALTPTYLGVLTGGGTTKSPVFCNGSVWVPS